MSIKANVPGYIVLYFADGWVLKDEALAHTRAYTETLTKIWVETYKRNPDHIVVKELRGLPDKE
jgi:hypothetical protein